MHKHTCTRSGIRRHKALGIRRQLNKQHQHEFSARVLGHQFSGTSSQHQFAQQSLTMGVITLRGRSKEQGARRQSIYNELLQKLSPRHSSGQCAQPRLTFEFAAQARSRQACSKTTETEHTSLPGGTYVYLRP